MSEPISQLSISVTSPAGSKYKSLKEIEWSNIPGLAILTGPNGSGKTQLLELMAYRLTGVRPSDKDLPVEVEISGSQYEIADIGYIPSEGRFTGSSSSSLASIPSIRNQALSHIQNMHSSRFDIFQTVKAHRALKLLSGVDYQGKTPAELADLFPDDFSFAIDDIDITSGIAHVFVSHRFKMLEALERQTPGIGKDGRSLGLAPWDVVNDALKAAGFPYESISPLGTSLADTYTFTLRDIETGAVIQPSDLSSGEKTILQLILWLFTVGRDGLFPKILLLDEPDAHLHPSMTSQFLSVINEVLVERYGVRVIMTTHSPSTVALAPEGSVFQMLRGANRIEKVDDRAAAVAMLTSGLVAVSKATKFCFVEDNADVDFYDSLYGILTDRGPSRDQRALNAVPSIAFISASVGSGPSKVGGGCEIVKKWVAKLDAEPLTKTFIGIIDRDAGNTPEPRIFVLGRYSLENYLLDPLNLFCTILMATGSNPVSGSSISAGDEHIIRIKADEELQTLVNYITLEMEASDGSLVSTTSCEVVYTTGQKVRVPSWVIDHRGHDLLSKAQKAFGQSYVTPPNLLKSWRRTRLVPDELATMLFSIQQI